jgi:hypothetical protein
MNTFLNETVISFFPNGASCAFVGERWFLSNHQLQWIVLHLCEEGYAHLIETSSDEAIFTQHVFNLANVLLEPQNLLEQLLMGIRRGEYLLTRGWFCRSLYRHVNLLLIRIRGYLHRIDAVAGDFDDHINSIIRQIQTNERMEREAPRTVNWRMHQSDDDDDDDDDDNDDNDDDDYGEPPCQMRRMNSDNYTSYTEVYDDDYDSNAEVDDADAHYGYDCYEGNDDDW